MRRFLLFLALIVSSAISPAYFAGQAAAQSDERDLREATFSAEEILRLAYERKFNAMYDRIHPDAHAVIPRVAAVGQFEAIYEELQVGEATITDSRLVRFTWGVTGKTYDLAAEISFDQPFIDTEGNPQINRGKMYLAKDGEWRWFFGETMEQIEAVIEEYGAPPAEPLVEGDLVVNVATDLEFFYRDVLSYTDFEYVTPGFVYVESGNSVNTACGPAETGFWGFFCPGDVTIYIDEQLIDQLEAEDRDFAAAFVIAHEWAHHVQTLVGFDRVQSIPETWNQVWSVELELMADCMAGAWAQDVDTRGLLEPDDTQEAVDFTIDKLGDPDYIDTYDPQAHGTDDQRRESFLTGFEDGFLGCNIVM